MRTSPNQASTNGLIAIALGFFGVVAAFYLLPRTIKFFIRKFVLGIVSEIVTVVITGLLSEKLVDLIGRERPSEAMESSTRP